VHSWLISALGRFRNTKLTNLSQYKVYKVLSTIKYAMPNTYAKEIMNIH